MNLAKTIILFCLLLMCFQPLSAQSRRRRLADLPPFERAVVCIKYFEGMHDKKDYPYVGYGHRLLPGEQFSPICQNGKRTPYFGQTFGNALRYSRVRKDALLLAVLSYNVGVGTNFRYGKHPKVSCYED